MSCSVCGADVERGVYHTRPDNLAACPGEKDKPELKAEPEKPVRKPRAKK
jgi:hypothetical protein